MAYHKEVKENEIWVGNVSIIRDLSYLKIAGVKFRRGIQAYDINGEKISKNYMLPLFVTKETFDKYNRVMEKL